MSALRHSMPNVCNWDPKNTKADTFATIVSVDGIYCTATSHGWNWDIIGTPWWKLAFRFHIFCCETRILLAFYVSDGGQPKSYIPMKYLKIFSNYRIDVASLLFSSTVRTITIGLIVVGHSYIKKGWENVEIALQSIFIARKWRTRFWRRTCSSVISLFKIISGFRQEKLWQKCCQRIIRESHSRGRRSVWKIENRQSCQRRRSKTWLGKAFFWN